MSDKGSGMTLSIRRRADMQLGSVTAKWVANWVMRDWSEAERGLVSLGSPKHTPGPWVYDSGCFYARCQMDESGRTYETL